jgi:hypothetical protein
MSKKSRKSRRNIKPSPSSTTLVPKKFYGYHMIQNPSNSTLALYVGAIDAKELRDIVSVDNAVKWDPSSKLWRVRGRNRTIDEKHWKAIQEFLSSSNQERILPSAIVISVDEEALVFKPFAEVAAIDRVTPGVIELFGRYHLDSSGDLKPVTEPDRPAWVLDGQHRIRAFREWSMPEPYPVNVIIIKAWKGSDYEDVMRHQTYELNMGRPLPEDFKASVREQYNAQLGHKEYKKQIALSWIRKDIEARGRVFSSTDIVGAAKLRTPYVVTMSFLEGLIATAVDHDPYLKTTYTLEKITPSEVAAIGKYLYDFFEGVRLSIGLINPGVKGTIGSEPEVAAARDYWDIATTTPHKQRLLHNVGLKACAKGLMNIVMRGEKTPRTPQEVAEALDHMRGIPWHDQQLQSKKDDWTTPLANALRDMYVSKGTSGKGKKYQILIRKIDGDGKQIDSFPLNAHGWEMK